MEELFDIKDKTIVITGAGGVLCGTMAKALAEAGGKIAVLDIVETAANKVVDEIRSSGGQDLYITTRLTKNDAWSAPVNLGPTINSSSDDNAPSMTSDGLTLIFSSKRPGKYSTYYDLWMTLRMLTNILVFALQCICTYVVNFSKNWKVFLLQRCKYIHKDRHKLY